MPNMGGSRPIQSMAQGQAMSGMMGPHIRPMSMDNVSPTDGSMRVPLSMLTVKMNRNARKTESRKTRAEEIRAQDEDDYLAMGLECPAHQKKDAEVVEDKRHEEDDEDEERESMTNASKPICTSQEPMDSPEDIVWPHWTEIMTDIRERDERLEKRIVRLGQQESPDSQQFHPVSEDEARSEEEYMNKNGLNSCKAATWSYERWQSQAPGPGS